MLLSLSNILGTIAAASCCPCCLAVLGLLQVVTAGRYEVRLSYTARHSAAFRLWLGPYAKIQAGSAQHIDVTLDAAVSCLRPAQHSLSQLS